MAIITKFTVATDQGIDDLLMLTRESAKEKFLFLPEEQIITSYIAAHLTRQALIHEVNSMSNQWLVVYADNEPAGYARITTKGKKPASLHQNRAIRIADFSVLNRHNNIAVRESLFSKCIAVCRSYENIWVNEYIENPLIDFFEANGFVRQNEAAQHDDLPLKSLYLIA
ncbi:N-acetyltransferase [Sediminibacterium ginsengisoli]|uniref:N-acetyltransferase domain-containing protein n=1 Tax=Sediminibacterium ginsengisoli TaxID=413434 RepID=A0A1T4K8N5_9BACT|nr:N-acetyltransferase [Sediminibacterium ginsengisoli]SJZ38707.1 hypothetical protein SAMN04488132_101531 [Sediminibacterium ginsengisoli]